MPRRDPSFPSTLGRWLDHLDQRRDEGFRIGVRERLTAMEWLRALDAQTRPDTAPDTRCLLQGLRPIFCTNPEQQRRYDTLLAQFLAAEQARARPASRRSPRGTSHPSHEDTPGHPNRDRLRKLAPLVPWLIAVVACLGMGWIAWKSLGEQQSDSTRRLPPGTNGPVATNASPFALLAPNTTFRFVTEQRVDPLPDVEIGGTKRALLGQWVGLGTAMGMALWAWSWWRRQVYLRQVSTNREVEEKILRGEGMAVEWLPMAALRRVAQGLRLRRAGTRLDLHLPATVAATARNAGIVQARWLARRTTPDHVALVEQRSPHDLLAWAAHGWIDALRFQGVGIEVFHHDGDPRRGCWKRSPDGSIPPIPNRMPWPEVAGRLPTSRLMVFGDAPVAHENPAVTRRWAAPAWVASLSSCHEKAWFVALPMEAWGTDEMTLSDAGFLVLPFHTAALETAMSFWTTGRPDLEWDDDWPVRYPRWLGRDGGPWLGRPTAPAPDVRNEGIAQLEAYLGRERFQWLAACAIFPGVSPAITAGMGRLLGVPRIALGLAAMASLPFFRHGFFPTWLRQDLVERLEPGARQRCESWLGERLQQAIDPGGEAWLRMGLPPRKLGRRLRWWWGQGRGVARDVVMAEFLHAGHGSRLARRLPEVVRRWLFQDASPAMGLKSTVVAALAVVGLGAWLGLSVAAPGRITVKAFRQVPTRWETVEAFTNSLGMIFVKVPAAGVWFSAYETRIRDYKAFAETQTATKDSTWKEKVEGTGGIDAPQHPVVSVSSNDAKAFCVWLTQRERDLGLIPSNLAYRLPKDLEWSAAVGLPKEEGSSPQERSGKFGNVYPWGTNWPPAHFTGNYADESWSRSLAASARDFLMSIANYYDGHAALAPVGAYPALATGLHDLSGNVWEWCEEEYSPGTNDRVLRGGSWGHDHPRVLLSSSRNYDEPGVRNDDVGCRVVLGVDEPARSVAK